MPKGDLKVKFDIAFPKKMNEDQKRRALAILREA
jgi:hypothetical protein